MFPEEQKLSSYPDGGRQDEISNFDLEKKKVLLSLFDNDIVHVNVSLLLPQNKLLPGKVRLHVQLPESRCFYPDLQHSSSTSLNLTRSIILLFL